mgnify:CR=1 FL=1
MKRANLIASVLVMAVAAYFYYLTFSFPTVSAQETGPAFVPRIYCGALMLLGLILFIQGLLHKEKEDGQQGKMGMVFAVMGVMLLYLFLIALAGFYASTVLMVLALLWIFKVRSPVLLICIPAGTALFVFLFFEELLAVPMPSGLFFS